MDESVAAAPGQNAAASSESLGNSPSLESEHLHDDDPSFITNAVQTLSSIRGKTEDWVQGLEGHLKKLPELALLLPAKHKDEVTKELEKLRPSGIVVESVAETSYQRRPRVLWILGYDSSQGGAEKPPAAVINDAADLIEGAGILKFHTPKDGPFALWPLHDHDVSVAIATCGSILDDEDSWWRKLLWTLRIMQPPGGDDLLTNLTRHYGREVCYCLTWDSLFTRSLWPLFLMILFFLISGYNAPHGTDDCLENEKIGSSCLRPFLFYFQMCMVFVWALVISIISSSRRTVLSFGGGEFHQEAHGEATQAGEIKAASTHSGTIVTDTKERQAGEASSSSTSGKSFVGRGLEDLVSAPIGHASAAANDFRKTAQVFPSISKFKSISRKVMLMSETHSALKVRRLNPEHVENSWRQGPLWKWTWRAIVLVAAFASLFFCFMVLSVFLSLKMFLIYEWGGCLVEDCDNAEAKHGIPGLLADIGVDLLMAIIFMALLGEVCKLVAIALVNLRNFEEMLDRKVMEDLLSLLIEGLGKVGFFMILAFSFLPSWDYDLDIPAGTIPDVPNICQTEVDYRFCHAMLCQGSSSTLCCSGTIFCAAKILPFEKRRSLFDNWLNGPFVVGGFVDLLPQIILPMFIRAVAGISQRVYSSDSDLADTAPQGSGGILSLFCRCCCCCCSPIMRLLACIFMLDGPVIGCCRFISFGQPFGPLKQIEERKSSHWPIPSFKVKGTAPMRLITKQLQAEAEKRKKEAFEQDTFREKEALHQAMLKEFNTVECLKESKMNFLFVAMFAPLKPLGVVFLLVAQIIRLHTRMPKLFLLSRRSFPRVDDRPHKGHETFIKVVVMFLSFWFVGLAAISYNRELPTRRQHPWVLASAWIGSGLAGGLLVPVLIFVFAKYRHGACDGCCRRREAPPAKIHPSS